MNAITEKALVVIAAIEGALLVWNTLLSRQIEQIIKKKKDD